MNTTRTQFVRYFCKNSKKPAFIFLSVLLFLSVHTVRSAAQSAPVTFSVQNVTLKALFDILEKQTDYSFSYRDIVVEKNKDVTLTVSAHPLGAVLDSLLPSRGLEYVVTGHSIVITSSKPGKIKKAKGKVTDNKGEAIIGANVIEKGTTNGTVTDMEGFYSLDVSESATLSFSYIGYTPREVKVNGRETIDVRLREDTQTLEEVVVVGYGTQKKKLVTGATVQVKGDDIQKLNTVNPLGALQSQSPGLNIVKTSGQPGEGFKVSIRGLGTTGNASPLFIVDGVTVENIDDLNPADIESLDVLKDAASAAIYGARAANGVILVTTRQGKAGKASIQYDGYVGFQNMYKKVETLNAQEYTMIMNEAAENSGMAPFKYDELVPDWQRIKDGSWKGTNWLDEILNKNAVTQNHSLSIVGGTEQSVYSLGLSYTSQEGIVGNPVPPEYDRYTFRINTEHRLIKGKTFDILKVGENMNYSHTLRNMIGIGGPYDNDLHTALKTNPLFPVYDESGDYHYAIPWNDIEANPVGSIYYKRKGNLTKNHYVNGNIYMVLQPVEKLTWRSSFGINLRASSSRNFEPAYSLSSTVFRTENQIKQNMSTGLKWIFENTVNYRFDVAEKHAFDALVGTSAEKSGMGESLSGSNVNSIFNDFEHAYLDNTKTIYVDKTTLEGAPWRQGRLLSFFGRVNYNYQEKYMGTVVMRADASSNFAPGERWGYFPSVSAGWVISKESFMEGSASWLDFLKIRASWGQNGNQDIEPFQYHSSMAFDEMYFPGRDKLQGTTAGYPSILANPDVTWETSEQTDIGLDAYLFGSRLRVAFDWYDKRTNNWLVEAPILGIIGTGAPFINGGDVKNTGFELGMNWNDQYKDLRYGVSFNLAYNKNKVLRIANSEGIIHGDVDVLSRNTTELYRAQVGYPIGYFWGYETDGLFQNEEEVKSYKNSKGELIQPGAKPGDIRFVNKNDDSTIDEKDKVMIGNPNPDFTFGFSFNFEYKGFDFNFVSNGVLGNQIAKSYRAFGARTTENYTKDILGRWHGEGTSNTIPRVNISAHINDQYISDRYIENGDYWRISNVTVGYDFKRLWKNLPLQQARIYVSAQNLCTVTGYSGFDPEVGYGDNWAGGIDIGSYPSPRVFLFGFSLKY